MSKAKLLASSGFSKAISSVITAASGVAAAKKRSDATDNVAIKALKLTYKKEPLATRDAFYVSYIATAMSASTSKKALAAAAQAKADGACDLEYGNARSAFSRLLKAAGLKTAEPRGGKNGGKGGRKPGEATVAKRKAEADAKAKEVQIAAKALAAKAGVLPPDGDTFEATTKYFMQWAATGLAVMNKKRKVVAEIRTAIATCHAVIAKVNASTK